MFKNKLIYLGATLCLLIGLIVFAYYNKYYKKTPDAKKLIDKIREQNKSGFDSLQNAINYENDLNYRIEKSIGLGDFKTAYSLMDSLPPFSRAHSLHLYRGMIFTEQKKYLEAIEEYTQAIKELPYSKGKSMRAELFVKMNKLELALSDYKEIYKYNHYYSYYVATTFLQMNKKDSALKYYQIYLDHYPNDTLAQQKISLLKPG